MEPLPLLLISTGICCTLIGLIFLITGIQLL